MSLDRFMQDGQDPKVVEKIYSKVEDMLSNAEVIKYVAVQKKPAVTLLPDCILISNRRIFLCEFTKLGLSTNFEIFSWKDIKDITFKEEIFGSKVTVIPFTGENLSIDYIPKTQARKLFQLIKDALEISKQEDDNLEKPKHVVVKTTIQTHNNTEENSAESPQESIESEATIITSEPEIVNTVESSIPQTTPTAFTNNYSAPIDNNDVEDEITQKLKKLKTLFDKQLISQSEYESKKAEILENL